MSIAQHLFRPERADIGYDAKEAIVPTPPALWDLPDHPSLAWLKKRAKDLVRRGADGDASVLALVARFDPGDGPVSLARAQRVLARGYGFASWARLREHVDTRSLFTRPMDASSAHDDAVDGFLRTAVLSYTEPSASFVAEAQLAESPSIATSSVFTLAACGLATELSALVATDPSAARGEGGPHRWTPLLYLCYSRIPQRDAAGTLRALLDHGADPNDGFLWKGFPSAFTALTGVLGGGERGEPPHPQSVELASILLDAGADPNDNQAFYNRMFTADDSHLPPLLAHGAGRDRPSPWRDRLGAEYPSAAEMVGEHLRSAAEKGFTHRVRLLLDAGIDANTVGYHPILGDATAYEMAVRNGHSEAAQLLADAGGHSDRLTSDDRAVARALTGESGPPRAGLPARRPDAMRIAGELHGIPAVEQLIALGYEVTQADGDGVTALHEAALNGNRSLVRWLLDHGADPSARDHRFHSTPGGWAAHAGHSDLLDLLGPDS